MAFTSVILTGVIELEPGIPTPGALVSMTLSSSITDGTTAIQPYATTVRTDASGAFAITVPANDDTTTTPVGTYYSVSVTYGVKVVDVFTVTVPHSLAPTTTLFSLPTG